MKASGLPRSHFYITSKYSYGIKNQAPRASIEASLNKVRQYILKSMIWATDWKR